MSDVEGRFHLNIVFPFVISATPLVLLALHVFWGTKFNIDETAGFLLVIVSLPWLYQVVAKIKFPGGE